MNTELGRRLHEVAADAPPTLHADGLWDRGVRQHRVRRATGALATVVVLAVLGGLGLQVADGLRDAGPSPAGTPSGPGHLPTTVHVPAPWSEGTDEAGELGVLAAIGSSDRKRPQGILGMVAYESMYGVSAVDGSVRFLDLPTSPKPHLPGELSLSAALSPDGRKVGFPRYDWSQMTSDGEAPLVGWGIYDTTTGAVVQLSDPAVPRMNYEVVQPIFTGDSRYLLTAYAPQGDNDNTHDVFVAWDVTTGVRTVVEEPGYYWTPLIGSGPGGVVWSRGDKTFTFDPVSGARSTVRTAKDVVAATFAPSGTAFAYLGGTSDKEGINPPWRVYVGPSSDRLTLVSAIDDANGFLGWRDAEHVVVGLGLQDYAVVDVTDGSVERGSFSGELNLNTPTLASDLWANALVAGVRPPRALDPRTPERIVALVGVVALGIAFGVARRRRRA